MVFDTPGDPAARGARQLVRVAGPRLLTAVPSLGYLMSGQHQCLPLHVLESIYSRVMEPDAQTLPHLFGSTSIGPDAFNLVEVWLLNRDANIFAVAECRDLNMR